MPVSSSLWSRAGPFRSFWLLRNSETSQNCNKDGPEQKRDMVQSPQHQRISTEQNSPHPNQPPPSTEHTPRMVLQKDFRKVSGISTEIFRQIETLENDLDDIAASAMEAVERKGEMIVCILNPQRLSKNAFELASKFLDLQNAQTTIQFVEIVKRPGQTLGLYIREGNGSDRCDGVFVSRIAIESAVYNSGCLCVGDEVVAVNLVDVRRMGLDDVVIIMSIPRRLILTIRQKKHPSTGAEHNAPILWPESKYNPVVVMKKELDEEPAEGLMRMSGPPPSVAPPPLPPRRQRIPESPYKYIKGPPMNCQPNKPPSYHDLYSRTRRSPYSSVGHQIAGRGLQSSDSWHSDASSVMSYQPPPPMATDPHRGSPSSLYDRATYSKALDSLAQHVKGRHMDSMMRPINNMYMASGVSNGYCSLPRNETPYRMRGRGVMRANSDQRLPQTETSGRDYSMSPVVGGNLPSTLLQHPMRYSETMRRLSAMRRRTASLDYASDSETMVGSRMMMHHRQRQQYQHQYSGSQAVPTQSAISGVNTASRSNSLPRDNMPPYRSRFNRMSGYNSSGTMDSQDESDGAISAPEVAARRGVPLPGMRPPSDYGQWMSRAPSTSAIYERVRNQREAAPSPSMANRVKFTLSEENIQNGFEDVAGYPYKNRLYPMRSQTPTSMHLGRPMSSTISNGTNGLAPLSQRLKNLLEERGATPTPPPGQESRFSVLNINPAEYLRYKSERTTSPSSEGVSGMLFVHLLSGRGLKPTTRSQQLRDLYCVLECDHIHKARTVIRTGDLVFDWDETFELDIIENRDLDFLIYSWDPQFRHKLCYKGSVSINTLLRESSAYQLAIKLEPHGSLYVQLRYTEPKRCFERAVSMSHSALFGADLETVVTREATGTGVPILVKRCIEEVERRGLDIIGLYRLCGSASKKALLREAFEKNPRAVDLSPDNIPDINVITGVLKDYLRELPEPLFTKCLYQMLCDALSVCLPDDPEGNAKLIFSILDCLPKVNRSTLMCVMDHLRLVTSQSDCNKMTPQNVAICFGPVFMIHSEIGRSEVDFHRPISVLKYLLRIWMTKTDREAVTVKAAPPIRRVRPSPLATSAQRKELASQVAHEERSDPPTTTTDSGSESRESSPNRGASRPGALRASSRKPAVSVNVPGNGSSSYLGVTGCREAVFPEAPVAPAYLRQSSDNMSQISALNNNPDQQAVNSSLPLSARSGAPTTLNSMSNSSATAEESVYSRYSATISVLKNGNLKSDSSDTEPQAISKPPDQQSNSQLLQNYDRGSMLSQSNGSNPFHSSDFSRKDQHNSSNPFQQVNRNNDIPFQNGSSMNTLEMKGDSSLTYVSHEKAADEHEKIQKTNMASNAQNIFVGNGSGENGQFKTSVLNGEEEPLDLT